jgi:hypothetical protein
LRSAERDSVWVAFDFGFGFSGFFSESGEVESAFGMGPFGGKFGVGIAAQW